ncbi:MAG: long-chain-fatty-acid--CoA ligase [Firmicutes bacterium]|nr:long-chain-fatty-acid--CoA ligase [Bacillota bacterium]MCL5039596.1 long-chain-fatty-acid--CoA ligase [Bacillota bacterium]
MNLASVLSRNARRHPEKEALVFEGKRYTYAQLDGATNSMAQALIGMGLKKGEKVALLLQNSDRFVVSYYGILKAGGVVVPLNFRLAAPEISYILENSDSKIFIYDPEFSPLVGGIRDQLRGIEKFIVAGEPSDPAWEISWQDLLDQNPPLQPDVEVGLEDDCEILYTSGTTGRPKGALFDDYRIFTVGLNMIVGMGINPKDRIIHVAPLFHSAQLNLFLVSGTYVGATHIVLKAFEPRKVLQTIQEEKVTHLFAVPAMYNLMIQLPDFDQYDLSSLQRCAYGAAPMPANQVQRVMARFKNDQFYNLCGLTEGGPGGIYLLPEDQVRKAGAGGKPIINTEARVVNDRGEDVKPGEVGEWLIRGETIMKGYYKNPAATAETFLGDWLKTGDLATIDEEGYITLVDRKKDMIITGGENVYSTEVEAVVAGHPKVMDVAVIGIPHEVWGETVACLVVPRPGQELGLEELRSFCQGKLADFKIPRIVINTTTLPRNASGKVLKTVLRSQYKNTGKST